MAHHGFEQLAHFAAHFQAGAEKQVQLAQHPVLHHHRDSHQGLIPCLVAMGQQHVFLRDDGDDARARLLAHRPAQAGPRAQALLTLGDGLRQAIGGQDHIALVGLIRPAHHGGIGPRHLAHLLHKPLGQRSQGAGVCGHGAHAIQGGKALVLHFHAGRFFAHLALQIFVRGLQGPCHQVKARCQLAKFIVGIDGNPCTQIAFAHTGQGLLHARYRRQHQEKAHGHEHRRRHHRHAQHENLEHVQRRRPAGKLGFYGIDETIHMAHECIGLLHHIRHGPALRSHPGGVQRLPFLRYVFKPCARIFAPGHKQGAHGCSRAQQIQAVVKLIRQFLQMLGVAGLEGQGHAHGVHAQAPRLVDGCCAAFELPGHPQGEANGHHGQKQKGAARGHQPGGQGGGLLHACECTAWPACENSGL